MQLYCGKFNWNRELHEEWVRARSKDQAFRLLCARLSTKLGKTADSVRMYFSSKANSYNIQEVIEDEQHTNNDTKKPTK